MKIADMKADGRTLYALTQDRKYSAPSTSPAGYLFISAGWRKPIGYFWSSTQSRPNYEEALPWGGVVSVPRSEAERGTKYDRGVCVLMGRVRDGAVPDPQTLTYRAEDIEDVCALLPKRVEGVLDEVAQERIADQERSLAAQETLREQKQALVDELVGYLGNLETLDHSLVRGTSSFLNYGSLYGQNLSWNDALLIARLAYNNGVAAGCGAVVNS